jgi:hypothetical protein
VTAIARGHRQTAPNTPFGPTSSKLAGSNLPLNALWATSARFVSDCFWLGSATMFECAVAWRGGRTTRVETVNQCEPQLWNCASSDSLAGSRVGGILVPTMHCRKYRPVPRPLDTVLTVTIWCPTWNHRLASESSVAQNDPVQRAEMQFSLGW